MTETTAHLRVQRVRAGHRTEVTDVVAVEAPLDVRVDGRPYAVLMRTPGDDRTLAAGFLLSERIIRTVDDVALIEHCADPALASDDARRNTVLVTLERTASERAAALLAERRNVVASSACGVCGKPTLEAMLADLAPLESVVRVTASMLGAHHRQLRERQPVFASTGGLHAAGVFGADGRLLGVAEDVGRHNAVDKVLGASLLRDELPLSTAVLFVSGRTSFEIVQKAWCAGIPVVASVSAPSSLAVSLASDAGITLVGFVRDEGLNIYTGAARIE